MIAKLDESAAAEAWILIGKSVRRWNLVPGENDTHYRRSRRQHRHMPGAFSSAKTFAAGTYTLSFDLAGQNRSYDTLTKTVTVSLGDWTETSLSPVWNAAFKPLDTYTFVTTTSGGSLSFAMNRRVGNNNVGDLLDNVSLVVGGAGELRHGPCWLLASPGLDLQRSASPAKLRLAIA